MRAVHVSILASFPIIIVFQNCSRTRFVAEEASSMIESASIIRPVSLNSFQLVNVELSTPKNFRADFGLKGDDISNYEASFDGKRQLDNITLNHGVVRILNSKTFDLMYVPEFGYRGMDSGHIFLRKGNGEILKMELRFSISNSLHEFAPALSIRGAGCVTCHARVASNFVTDFGFGGDGQAIDYYFGSQPTNDSVAWNSGSIYGDHGSGIRDANGSLVPSAWQTLKMSTSQKILVPAARVPNAPATMWEVSTLAEYLRKVLSSSVHEESKSVQVEERQIFIGAPSQTKMREAFKSSGTATCFQFFPEGEGSDPLSGFEKASTGTYVYNKGNVNCEGDVFVEGSLFLRNLQLSTVTGCRLYVTGTVLISGPITYLRTEAPLRNLQITSSKAILMGVGSLMKDNSLCERAAGQFYFDEWAKPGLTEEKKRTFYSSSLLHRLRYIWTTPSFFTRTGATVTEAHESVISDVEKMGSVLDASCESQGTAIAFDRIFLNAPMIHSRYNGDVSGTLVSEYALMRLGKFKFQYDPVFSKVPVLPFLRQEDYLDIK